MFLQTLTLATCLTAAPDSESLDGTRLLIDALAKVEEIEDQRIHGRLPPRFVLSWEADWDNISDVTALPAAEHDARLESIQPFIQAIMQATEAEPGPFDVSMLPGHQHNGLFTGARRDAAHFLLADAERMLLADSPQQAADRVVAALRVVAVSLKPAEAGGFVKRGREVSIDHIVARSVLAMISETLCIMLPHLTSGDRARIESALSELEQARSFSEPTLPYRYTAALFEWATTYDGPFRWSWLDSVQHLVGSLWTALKYDDPEVLDDNHAQVNDLSRLSPFTRHHFWQGIRQMHESASPGPDSAASLRRYAQATVRGESGAYGITVQHDVGLFRTLAEDWFTLTDHVAAVQDLLDGHPPIEVEPGPTAVTFAGLRTAFAAEMNGATRGGYESTQRASEIALSLRDVVTLLDPGSISEAQRSAMLRDLGNLRPDDPLRFEANSRRVTERMFLEMHEQIETEWTTRDRFRDHAPEWFTSHGVVNAANGVQKIIDSIDAEQDFQNRLHELARGWLASELSRHGSYDVNQLRYPADGELERWEDDTVSEYDLELYGLMAVYLPRDWFDDLVAVQEGTRALWELREFLEAYRMQK